jgi:hypothetical protein
MKLRWVLVPVVAAILVSASPASAVPACPISYGTSDDAKPNKLYVYFPSASDAAFPEFSLDPVSFPTSPVQFDVSQLSSYSGTAADLESGVFDVVSDDYCEFNVQVRLTTTAPPTTFVRRNTVGIGSNSQVVTNSSGTSRTWGQAQAVDTGDSDMVDFAREWAGTYNFGPGGTQNAALTGANATLARWATSIGGTAAHEGGHNYGLSHTDGTAVGPGEDALTRHVMASGGNYTDEQRAGYRRHFSDHEMSVLASNVGLSIQTMHNWDLVNTNAASASGFRLTFLAPTASVVQSWSYTGNRSPWINPTVSGSLGTTTFKGQTYHRHTITWTTGQNWTGGSSGVVPGGAGFHVGATFSGIDFNQPDPIIVTKSELLDANGNPLALSPRLPGYDAGTLDAADGSFDLDVFAVNGGPIRVEDVLVRQFPRVVSLDALVPGARLFDVFRQRMRPWKGTTRTLLTERGRTIKRGGTTSLTLARLGDRRHILERVGSDCDKGDSERAPDVASCRPGYSVDLFPATTTVIRATIVLPHTKHYVRKRKRYVVGDVRETVFLQIGGRHPDLNRNGRDDAIDLVTRKSKDANGDGVPDEAQRRTRG